VRAESAFLFGAAAEHAIAVVTHAGFIRALLTSLYRTPNAEAWQLTREYGSIVALDTNLIRKCAPEESAGRAFGTLSKKRSNVTEEAQLEMDRPKGAKQ
jgi:broad specificity phosphatase PhoE